MEPAGPTVRRVIRVSALLGRQVERQTDSADEARVVRLRLGVRALTVELGVAHIGVAIAGRPRDGESRAHGPLAHALDVEAERRAADVRVRGGRVLDLTGDREDIRPRADAELLLARGREEGRRGALERLGLRVDLGIPHPRHRDVRRGEDRLPADVELPGRVRPHPEVDAPGKPVGDVVELLADSILLKDRVEVVIVLFTSFMAYVLKAP